MDPRDAVNRDLLIGLLALQTGLVDQDGLILAFRAWTRDKSRPIAEILAAGGTIDVGERALLEGLAAKHLTRHGGDAEKSLAALGPSHSIRASLAKIGDPEIEATLGHHKGGSGTVEADDAEQTRSYAAGTATSDGNRFRVLRPHAQGGLGAVFVALDAELNREVALKQILDHHADDPTSRMRFVLEAEITGGLEHPGIVPVYGLGNYGDGRPYYAMRFVRGESLKETIAAFHADESRRNDPGRRSLALRKLLRRFVDVCNAIDYAHTRGILHRDIKPANVIVGKHGETLVVDWGLAKPLSKAEPGAASDERTLMPSSTSGSAETLPGSTMGTPAYMSPEQASGDLDQLSPRSDVYSLGATLYYLLTNKPPFEGEDLGAVLRSVCKGDFPPPRTLDPALDPALEAVCLKAMALKPDDRYATSRMLADDVERWAADEPVSAWPEPLSRRARRWARRNRTAVTAAAATVMMAVLGLSAILAVEARSNAALTAANARLELSNQREVKANADLKAANDRERARFTLAQDAIRTFYTGVSEDLLLKQKEFDTLRTKLLRGAQDFYRRLEGLLEGQKDRESRLALGRAYRDVGELMSAIGSNEEALAVHERALGLFEDVAREAPDEPELRYEIGKSCIAIGGLQMATSRSAEGLAAVVRARTILSSLVEAGLADDRSKCELAQAEHYYGSLVDETDRSHEQLPSYERARAILMALVEAKPSVERFRVALASICDSLGLALRDARRPREASSQFDQARKLSEALVEANSNDPKFVHELARTVGNWTTGVPDDGSNAAVTEALERTRKILTSAHEANPTNLVMQADLAWIETLLGGRLMSAGRRTEALALYERALAARARLSKANPTSTRHIEQQIGVLRMIGSLHAQDGRPNEALASFERARRIGEKAAHSLASDREVRNELAYVYQVWGDLMLQRGHGSEALVQYERMRATEAMLVKAYPQESRFRAALADSIRRIGTALQAAGRAAEAVAHYRQSIAELERLANPTPVAVYDMACCQALIAGAIADARSGFSFAEGQAEAERAVAGVRRAVEAGYTGISWIREGDPDLKSIRSHPDFKLLLMDLSFPPDPFVRRE